MLKEAQIRALANPEVSRNSEFIEFLYEPQPKLPVYMIQSLEDLQQNDTLTPRGLMEVNLASFSLERTVKAYRIVNCYLNDSTFEGSADSAKHYLRQLHSPDSYRNVAMLALENNQVEVANAYLDSIENIFQLSDYEYDELSRMRSFLSSFDQSFYTNERDILELEAHEIENLITLSNSNAGMAATRAKNILTFNGYAVADTVMQAELNQEKRARVRVPWPKETPINEGVIAETVFYPNPVQNLLVVNVSTLQENGVIEIADMQGKILEKHKFNPKSGQHAIDVTHLAKGIYVVKIKQNGNTVYEHKVAKN